MLLRFIVVVVLPIILGIALYQFYYSWGTRTGSDQLIHVNITDGELFGKTELSRDGKPYYSFTSIPFAEKPVGNLRFQAPVKNKPFPSTLDATKETPACLQADPILKTILGESDCLYLNVYTPKVQGSKRLDKSDLLDVLVYFHGGHFQFGFSQMYGPQYFMDEDVVVCTINYRVGVLGFLNTGDSTISGNMGLKDQRMALEWIQANIHVFGGNKESITLVGESAGGFSVMSHLLSKSSEGLFSKGITQSGSSLNPWGFTKNPKEQAIRLGKKLKCNADNSSQLLSCLLEKSSEEIVETQREIFDIFHPQEAIFAPSIESKESNPNAFLTESPIKLLKDGKFAKVPLLTGIVPAEGGYRSTYVLLGDDYLQRFNDLYYEGVGTNTLILSKLESTQELLKKIWEFYFGKIHERVGLEHIQNLTNLYSDRYFINGIRKEALFHSEFAPVYMYQMSYRGRFSAALIQAAALKGTGPKSVLYHLILEVLKSKLFSILNWEQPDFGVVHGDDVLQFFQLNSLIQISKSDVEYEFSKALVRLWVDFAKGKKPLKFMDTIWEPIKPGHPLKYLDLNTNPKMIDEPFLDRMLFWESLNLIEN